MPEQYYQPQPNPSPSSDAELQKAKRAAQARLNGAHSQGPTTPDGKARSSQNSLKHGFASKHLILIGPDDSDAWDEHLAGYRDSYRPTNYAEHNLVEELAYTSWCKARLASITTALIDYQLTIQDRTVREWFPTDKDDMMLHLALAWQGLARAPLPRQIPLDPNEPIDPTIPPDQLNIDSIELARRYTTAIDRQFRNALLNLRQYRKDFAPPTAPTTAPSEPRPSGSGPHAPHTPNEPTKLTLIRSSLSP